MKILTVLTYYHPHWTGLTANAKRIAEGLAARGHDVTVLTTRHAEELAAVGGGRGRPRRPAPADRPAQPRPRRAGVPRRRDAG